MSRRTALYVHVPFCTRVCPYCAFAVTSSFDPAVIDQYLEAIERELDFLAMQRPLDIETVYVGGGTPSVLDPVRLTRLLQTIGSHCEPGRIREFTVETNPENTDDSRIDILKRFGVTRVSVGAQSFNDRFLGRLGRTHSGSDVIEAVLRLKTAGVENLNVDLIYGVRGQTIEDWLADLARVIDLGVGHVSLYELTLEAGTPFGRGHERGQIKKPHDEVTIRMFRAALERLASAGINWYEVSNFAKPGRESLHNQVYWRNEAYYGVGPGAYGCDGTARTMNASGLDDWRARVMATGSGVAAKDVLSARDTFIETLLSGLRTRDGVDLAALAERTGIDARVTHASTLAELAASGLGALHGNRFALAVDGVLLLDSILDRFLDMPDAASRPSAR
jgi:oxygen-independent coproporphyrinogen III oxidase